MGGGWPGKGMYFCLNKSVQIIYTTLTNFSTKNPVMYQVYTDVGGNK